MFDESNRLTITESARIIGVVPKTIIRWENSGKVRKAKRDWRNWRVYSSKDID
ncbi:MAG: MerR family transcriptional regulator, partial [Candidatus Omnitrophica bacterium]|nr:MerR family transcriptional regulator [Candidatus Omnitrophota bacterium]